MKKKVVVVCIIAAALGLLSAALGFAAEGKKFKQSEVDVRNNVCRYPASPAFALGNTGALTLLMALIIINASSGCYCCYRRHSRRCECNVALICFVFSWITFVPAFLLLLGAAALNNQQSMDGSSMYFDDNCYVVKSGVFAGAACLSFISVALGITYYLSFTSGNTPPPTMAAQTQGSGIAMGHPQVPPITQQPAFVHEDTYMRRQFT